MIRRLRNLFGGGDAIPSTVEVLPDHVWVSTAAKFAGIRRAVGERAGRGATMIALVAHFPDVLAELEPIADGYEGGSVRAVLGRQLAHEAAGRLPLQAADVFDLVVAERHPLASADAALLAFAAALPCRCRMVHHVSLDDPVLRRYGENLRALMERLGAADDEAITNPLVTRAIRRAQEHLEAAASGRDEAESAAVWIERNAPRRT